MEIVQASHGHGESWKTMENEKIKSRPGKVMENVNFSKNHGKVMEFCKKPDIRWVWVWVLNKVGIDRVVVQF